MLLVRGQLRPRLHRTAWRGLQSGPFLKLWSPTFSFCSSEFCAVLCCFVMTTFSAVNSSFLRRLPGHSLLVFMCLFPVFLQALPVLFCWSCVSCALCWVLLPLFDLMVSAWCLCVSHFLCSVSLVCFLVPSLPENSLSVGFIAPVVFFCFLIFCEWPTMKPFKSDSPVMTPVSRCSSFCHVLVYFHHTDSLSITSTYWNDSGTIYYLAIVSAFGIYPFTL